MKAILVAVIGLLLAACSKPVPPEPVEEHAMHGVVLRLDAEALTATVKHDEIKGFMGAMTMEYSIRDKDQFAQIKPGEWINATVIAKGKGKEYWMDNIKPARP